MASPDKKAFLLRLPPDVWAQLVRLAASELRSVNGQIEYLLREALAKRMGPEQEALNRRAAKKKGASKPPGD